METIHGITFKEGLVVFRVTSTGCTKKDDFIFSSSGQNGIEELTLVRETPDTCKRMPHVIEISFTPEEMGLETREKFRILNSIFPGFNF